MADKLTPEQRSRNMSKIRSSGTKPEELVLKYLFSKGLRYRKNDRRYPGKPDGVFPKHRAALFVNGCFWHWHEGCAHFRMPQSNREFWETKLARNRARDERTRAILQEAGWRVVTVWECELTKAARDARLEELYAQITGSRENHALRVAETPPHYKSQDGASPPGGEE